MRFAPDSWGADLREVNRCHGKGKGHPCTVTRVGITSSRGASDPMGDHTDSAIRTRREAFARDLQQAGVGHVKVGHAKGVYKGGHETSWSVGFVDRGGKGRRLCAEYGKATNQESVLLMHSCREDCNDVMVELNFSKSLGKARRAKIDETIANHGLGGWSWYRRGKQVVLRMASVEVWRNVSVAEYQAKTDRITAEIRQTLPGRRIVATRRKIKTDVLSRADQQEGTHYEDVLAGRG